MVVLYRHISEGSDDAQEAATVTTLTDALIESDATTDWLGFRFQNILIPPGSTVTDVLLQVVPATTGDDEPEHTFFGVDEDNCAQWTTDASNISGRSRTTASVLWDSANLGATGTSRHSTPSLHTIVQEIIDRPGWASGNAIGLMCQGSATATRDLRVCAYETSPSTAAHLQITYTAPLGSTGVSGQVAASADDAGESAGTVTIDGVSVLVDATNEYAGMRFQAVAVPKAAVITSAWLSLAVISASDDPNHTIYGEDANDSAAFTTGASNISARSATSATVTWTSLGMAGATTPDTFFSTPELKTIVQEIVDRAGWASGNDMSLIIQGSADGARDLAFELFDGDSLRAPKLEIVYVNPAGGKGTGGKGKGGNTPGPGEPPKKPLRTSLTKSWKWDRGWR
jgi:type IV pilus assembly protein PilY1